MAWTLIKTARRTDPGTSHAAAADMQPKLANLQAALLAAFQAAGEGGLTSDEAETAAAWSRRQSATCVLLRHQG